MQHALNEDHTLERLVNTVTSSSLVALGQALLVIERPHSTYSLAATNLNYIGTRLVRAAHDVRSILCERHLEEEKTAEKWLKSIEGALP